MASRFKLVEQEYDDRYAAGEFDIPTDQLRPGERRNIFTQYPGTQREVLTPIPIDDDPLWSDYGKMILSGGVQLGAGVGWLANNFEWGRSLQVGAAELSQSIMDDVSPQAKKALATEFTVRDEGQLWTNNKWSRAKLIAAQSLLGTAAGMGVGSILTRGLAAAGMTKAVTTAAGKVVQVPTKTAGAIGYGLGEAGVAAPGSAAAVQAEIMEMSHEELMEDAADYRAIYVGLENANPRDRARRAREILAAAAAGDVFAQNMVYTFILSAPLGAVVGGYTRHVPLLGATTRPRSMGLGAVGEAGQEFFQSGSEKLVENLAMRDVDPTREVWGGVFEEAVGGGIAGGMMGGTMGVITPLDAQGREILPDPESPLSALARAEQDELDAALDRELAAQDALEREAENQALRDLVAAEEDAVRGVEMVDMEERRARQLGRLPPTDEIQAYKSAEQIRREEEIYLAEHPEITEKDIKGPLKGENRAPGRYTEDGFLVEQMETRLERPDEREARERELGFRDIARERENQRLLDYAEAGEEIEKGRLGGAPTATMITPRVGLDEEQLRRTGLQPAEGEIVAGLPVETAGRVGVSVGEALVAAQERAVQKEQREARKMGVPVPREELIEPAKPEIPPTTKAFNPRRDNIIIAAAKGRGLDKDAWAAEGVDPSEFREPENAYGSRRAFRRGGMTPDEATEWAAELGFVPVDEHGKGEPHAALEAIMATLGGNPVYTLEGEQYAAEQRKYEEEVDRVAQERDRREGLVGEWDLTVEGQQVRVTENNLGEVTVQYGDTEVTTVRQTEDESNMTLVRAVMQSVAAGEDVIRDEPVTGAPVTEEEQIVAERAAGKELVDKTMPGAEGAIEATEEEVNDLEDAFFADGWKFNATEQEYTKGERTAVLTEIEEGRWKVEWSTAAAPAAAVPAVAPVEEDLFGAPELDDVADALGEQISMLTPESSSTDRNIAIADLGRLKRARHPRADDLAQRLKEALGEVEAVEAVAPGQRFNLDWMPATLRVRIMSDSAQSFSRMDKTSLQAYAIRIGISDQGTKIQIAQRIKDAVATIQPTVIDEAAAQPIADMVERKAKYATKKKLTKIQKEALVQAVGLSLLTTDGEVFVDDLSARNVGGQAIDGLVQKGTIELVGEEATYYAPGSKFKVNYMPKPEVAPAAPVTPAAPAAPAAEDTLGQQVFKLGESIKEKYDLDSFEVAINNDGEIELYDIEVPVGMQNQQKGSRAIRELAEFADANNLPIRLEPALGEADLRPREGLDRFYSRLGFAPDEALPGYLVRPPGVTPETEAEIEAREEREAIQAEELVEEEELGEIPGFEDLAEETATSPESDMPMPTEEQKEAGNYKKAHITIKGILITIENAVGSIRNGFRMMDHYGYIKRTEGVDGDQVDVFVNPAIQTDYNNQVYIIDQLDERGQFDEHKVMLGYASQLAAVKAYKSNYEPGWTVGPVTTMSMPNFKLWLADDAATKRPVSEKITGRERAAIQRGRPARRRLLYSLRDKNDARFEDAQDSVNAPNRKWVSDVLTLQPEQAEALKEESAMSKLVTQVINLDEALTALEAEEAEVRAYGRAEIERDTLRLRESMPNADIQIMDSYLDAPADVIAEMEEEGMTETKGVMNPRTGEVYLFSDKIANASEATRTAVHEGTHVGLTIAFG